MTKVRKGVYTSYTSVRHGYYFYPDGRIMKAHRQYLDRPDNLPDRAVIFYQHGELISGDLGGELTAPPELMDLFRRYLMLKSNYENYPY